MTIDICLPALGSFIYWPQSTGSTSLIAQKGSQSIAEICSRLIWRRVAFIAGPTAYRHPSLPPVWILGKPFLPLLMYSHVSKKPFPFEIWIQIVEEYSSHREWLALCKTCWFFHQIAQACLYKEVVLCRYRHDKVVDGHLSPTLALFERSFHRRPELGTLVHDLFLRVDFLLSEKKKRYSKYSLLSKLDQFPNLKTLRVQTIHIDANLLRALHSHPRLTSVELSHCELDSSLVSPQTQHFPGCTFSELKILSPNHNLSIEEGKWASLAPTGLRSLTLSSGYSQSIYLTSILTSIMKSGRTHMLEKLSISFFRRSIVEFLISSPQLRQLMIRCPVDNHDCLAFSTLPTDAICHLEHYSGPAGFSETLLRNRPVHTVGFSYFSYSPSDDGRTQAYVDALASLGQSSVPVTKLELWNTPIEPSLWHVPATVRHLTFPLEREAFMKSLHSLLHLTNLHTICGLRSRPNIFRGEEIMRISTACPSLRELDLRYERWLMVQQNVWKSFRSDGSVLCEVNPLWPS